MYIETVPNRGSPPAILLRESYRDGGRIRKRTLLNLSHWPAEHVEGLRGVLKGGVVLPPGEQPFAIERSLPHGAVAAVLGAARAVGLDRLLGSKNANEPNRPRDLVMAMIVGRIIAPASKLATAKALDPATAAWSLGVELALGEVGEDELYAALDWLLERQPARRGRPRQTPSQGRDAGAVRRLVELCRRPLLPAGQTRLQPRRQEGQAADRLRPSLRARRLPRRHRGVRRKHLRSHDPCRPGRQAQAPLRHRPRRAGRRSRHDHAGAHRRGPASGRARLDHRLARPRAQGAGRRRPSADVAVRRARHGGDHLARLSRRAADRLPQPRSRARARQQARGPPRRYRARSGQNRSQRHAQDAAPCAARPKSAWPSAPCSTSTRWPSTSI